ncbi:MAG: hypothetical protein QHH06_06525 [Clostridiales bacterium]|jgi:hypothetical protein|nr:hypothetical protein [Clostridiales bacterium]
MAVKTTSGPEPGFSGKTKFLRGRLPANLPDDGLAPLFPAVPPLSCLREFRDFFSLIEKLTKQPWTAVFTLEFCR